MTEDQAREKWCPMVRYPLWPDECSGGNEGAKCIASDCMMWRRSMLPDGEPEYAAKAIGGGHFENAPCGYCGLTNKP